MMTGRCYCPADHNTKDKRCYRKRMGLYVDFCAECTRRGVQWTVRLDPNSEMGYVTMDKTSARHVIS